MLVEQLISVPKISTSNVITSEIPLKLRFQI